MDERADPEKEDIRFNVEHTNLKEHQRTRSARPHAGDIFAHFLVFSM
jgi:hypothetical protein